MQLLSRDFISIFHTKFRYLAQKNKYLALCADNLTHKNDWDPIKNFQGPPAPRGPGQFAPPPPPAPLSAALRTIIYTKTVLSRMHWRNSDLTQQSSIHLGPVVQKPISLTLG
jgi:hypothetical protein